MSIQHDRIEGLAQALFEEVADALFLFDPRTLRILDANSTAQRMSGFSLPALLRRSLDDVFWTENPSHLKDLHLASRKTTLFQAQERYFMQTVKREVRVPVTLTFSRLHVTPETLGLVTARDPRPRPEPKAEKENAEADLHRMLASLPDCIWSGAIDDRGQYAWHYVSPAIEKITGQPAAYFAQDAQRWRGIIHPEDKSAWTQARARQRLGESTRIDYRILLPDGASRRVSERITVSRTEKDSAFRLDGIITEMRDD